MSRVDFRQIHGSDGKRLQGFVRRFGNLQHLRMSSPLPRLFRPWIEGRPAAKQHKRGLQDANDLVDARSGIGHVGDTERQPGPRRAEHGVDQARAAIGNDDHPV